MPRTDQLTVIAKRRLVRARAVIYNRVDLTNYPHRILVVYAARNLFFQRFTDTIIAAEILEQQGWELISVTPDHGRFVFATMRRRWIPFT
ncbi:hypothetical protein ACQPZQ_35550 [Pseudonocardia sp. CA-142604]|uniref:hypothetical protein n=1 Tax=Pseudonocardia sp. CA-142604 TaxID=3240024 RepID=UPI003D92D6B8